MGEFLRISGGKTRWHVRVTN